MMLDNLHIDLLGPFATRICGETVEGYRSQKTKWMLGFLALQNGAEVEFDLLAETFWLEKQQPCDEANITRALASVRQSVSNLVDIFGSDRISKAGKSRVKLNVNNLFVDALEFDAAINNGSIAALKQAIDLHKGDLLPGCHDDWVQTPREKRRIAYRNALRRLAEEATKRQDYETAEGFLRLLVAANPSKEGHRADLMILLVRRGEDHAALEVFNDWRNQIANPKVSVGSELQKLNDSILVRISKRSAASSPIPVNVVESSIPAFDLPYELPYPMGELIGREVCLTAVRNAVSQERLTMLQGPPGVGKTQVALHAANKMRHDYPGGSMFLDLAGISNETALVQEIANAMQIFEHPAKQLNSIIQYLRPRRFLLLLDNCEEISRKGGVIVESLLKSCPSLTILGTSRNVWNQDLGEKVLAIEPLHLPEQSLLHLSGEELVKRLSDFSAVQLFRMEAANVLPNFVLSAENAHAVAELCLHLDGLPLALRLIAGWAHTLSPAEMLMAVQTNQASIKARGDRYSERHKSLIAAIELSYGMLEPEEQRLFRRLAVFNSGWTQESAEFVCDEPNGRERLSTLQERSLIFSQESEQMRRFGFLQSLRQFAHDKMNVDDFNSSKQQHLSWFVMYAEQGAKGIAGPDQQLWLNRLERERGNLNAALHEARQANEDEKGIRIASALRMFWYIRGPNEEGASWLRKFLAIFDKAPTALRASALNAAGTLAMQQGEYESAKTFFNERLEIERFFGNVRGIANGLGNLGNIFALEGDDAAATEQFELSLAYFRQIDDQRGIAFTLGNLAAAAHNQNWLVTSIAQYTEAVARLRKLDDKHHLAVALANMAYAQCDVGDFKGSTSSLEESLSISTESGDQDNLLRCLYISVGLFAASRLMLEGAIVLGIVESMSKTSKIPLQARAIPWHEENKAIITESLNDLFDEAFSLTESWTDEAKIEEVCHLLKVRPEDPPMPPPYSTPDGVDAR